MQSLRNCFKFNYAIKTTMCSSGLRNLSRDVVPCGTVKTAISGTQTSTFPHFGVSFRSFSAETNVPTYEVTYLELQASASDPFTTIIDVRQPEELQETGSVPGSINVPLPTLNETLDMDENKFEELFGHPKPDSSDDIIFYCKAGVRSGKALALALSRGYHRSKHYPGGWLGWVEETSKLSQ